MQPLAAPQFLTFGNGFPNEAATLSLVLPDGTHQLTAQFVGDRDLHPVTSAPIIVTVGSQTPPAGTFAIAATPTAQSISAGQTATYSLKIIPENGFTGSVTPTCGGLPQQASCSVTPTSVALDGKTTTSISITIVTVPRSTSQIHQSDPRFGFTIATAISLLTTLIALPRLRTPVRGVTLMLLLFLSLSCGGTGNSSRGSGGGGGTPSGTFPLTFIASSHSVSRSTIVMLTIK
jgi:hypothetical protein